MLAHRRTRNVYCRQQCTRSDNGRALNVIIEGTEAITVAVEKPRGIIAREVLPLQQYMWPTFRNSLNKDLDEIVICLTAYALVAPAYVQRIGETLRIVSSDIERDRKCGCRIETAAARVQGYLADRNSHAASALITETEDALTVGDHDRFNIKVKLV